MTKNLENDSSISKTKSDVNARLPCRGCTLDCKHHQRCDGLPWRMTSAPDLNDRKKV